MKKILLLIAALSLFTGNLLAQENNGKDDKDKDPPLTQAEIDLLLYGQQGGVRPVSFFPDIQAWTGEVITVKFNWNLGDATVYVYDENEVLVSSASCDAFSGNVVTLAMPVEAGTYRIHIVTEYCEAEGFFDL